MPSVSLTNALKDEYQTLFATMEIKSSKFAAVDRIVDGVVQNRQRYQAVAGLVGAPWYFVAAIHNMESSMNFSKHLHNGDSLSARTRHVPAGRPAAGEPPFSWEESAEDALRLRRIDDVSDWSLASLLYELEGYNGWGYRRYHAHVKTPYLWSYSNHYTRGKYVADGTWSDTAVSRQCGAAVIIKRLEQRGEMDVLGTGTPPRSIPLRFSNRELARADDLQRFLNTFVGISLRVDGQPGEKTSDAVKKVFGFHLDGDPRNNG